MHSPFSKELLHPVCRYKSFPNPLRMVSHIDAGNFFSGSVRDDRHLIGTAPGDIAVLAGSITGYPVGLLANAGQQLVLKGFPINDCSIVAHGSGHAEGVAFAVHGNAVVS